MVINVSSVYLHLASLGIPGVVRTPSALECLPELGAQQDGGEEAGGS